jgi:glycosyltransferase involved in cell wall biosynthesis
MPKIAIQQPIIADYRMGLFRLLREKWGVDFQVFAGDSDFGGSPVSTPEAWRHFERVRNVYLCGQRFLWQVGCFKHLLEVDVAILNANLRILSNIIVLVLRSLVGKRTLLWGHVEGKNRVAGTLRGVYLRFCDGFISYTHSQSDILRLRYPWLRIWVASNACVSVHDCRPVEAAPDLVNSFLYVGRLVAEKKVRLLLESFIEGISKGTLSSDVRLVFVGDGGERLALEMRAKEAGVEHRVDFVGHVSAVSELRRYYARAICSVSPGYVGLSATQSFSFGVPMLIARDEFHSPEIEACKEGFNADFFESNSTDSLLDGLQRFVLNKEFFIGMRQEVSELTSEIYSFEIMCSSFVEAVESI